MNKIYNILILGIVLSIVIQTTSATDNVKIVPLNNVYEVKIPDAQAPIFTLNIDAKMWGTAEIQNWQAQKISVVWKYAMTGNTVLLRDIEGVTQITDLSKLKNGIPATVLKLTINDKAKSNIYLLSITLSYFDFNGDRQSLIVPPITLILSKSLSIKGAIQNPPTKILSIKIPKEQKEEKRSFKITITSLVGDDIQITGSSIFWKKEPTNVIDIPPPEFLTSPTINGKQSKDYYWDFWVGPQSSPGDYEMILVIHYKKDQEDGFFVVDPLLHLYREEGIKGYSLGLSGLLILSIYLVVISIWTIRKKL